MSIRVKTHPLAEIIAKKLLGIEYVPQKEMSKMVVRAVKAAVKYHDSVCEEQDNPPEYHTADSSDTSKDFVPHIEPGI